ncbi:hypothetical protein OG226_49260 [Streptomyces sp. NBC_01261]|uniref:hypothetical protein n=1 Tax=Streptomyces sp. NBC_01261 TaxID=2903802 RepID=UPI002E33244E|nr:hypothetical protein [Streptomyces sp. NBC_01261]
MRVPFVFVAAGKKSLGAATARRPEGRGLSVPGGGLTSWQVFGLDLLRVPP